MTLEASTASARDSMSEPEKNIWFLQTFFSPKAKPYCLAEYEEERAKTYMWYWIPSGKPRRTHDIDSRPIPDFLTNWNHWRDLERRVLSDKRLLNAFLLQFDPVPGERSIVKPYMKAELPRRARGLYLAYQSLR